MPEGEFEGDGGVKQSDDLFWREILGVLGVGWEVLAGARVVELRQLDFNGGGDSGADVLDVRRGAGDGDGENRGSTKD